jgi:hypothetical protein
MAEQTEIKREAEDGSPSAPGSGTVVGLILLYVVLAALVVWASHNFTDWSKGDTSLRDFATLVAAGLAASGVLVGFVVSVMTLRKNQEAAVRLEILKSELQGKVEASKLELQTNLEEYKSELQTKIFSQKIWTDLRFEHEKQKAASEAGAYAKLWNAIDGAYLTLAKLETGTWSTTDSSQMDNALLEARAQLVYMRSEEHQTVWEKARQRARYISEEAAKIGASDQRALWEGNIREFAAYCADFKKIANEEIHRPPPTQAPAAT